jgi:hypothetical protein
VCSAVHESVVQASPSLHWAALVQHPAVGAWPQTPVAGLQLSTVQRSLSSQSIGGVVGT